MKYLPNYLPTYLPTYLPRDRSSFIAWGGAEVFGDDNLVFR